MASLCEALGSSDCISIGVKGVKAFVAAYISVNSLCVPCRAVPCVLASPCVFVCESGHTSDSDGNLEVKPGGCGSSDFVRLIEAFDKAFICF